MHKGPDVNGFKDTLHGGRVASLIEEGVMD
ncbi:hypothetical protein EYZ11_004297 [Aspergillus tanneri]|uniref:Uncharacterized protein n=1 Tax=Aspergillus tanneri TaxID=1220188 RepID=A0A4S3JKU9_9EURO|nr:hypothetical protein EYZ11_004297 [Aspergillus tanneri]